MGKLLDLRGGDDAIEMLQNTSTGMAEGCRPPGPDDRDARTTISDNGSCTPRVTRIGSSIG